MEKELISLKATLKEFLSFYKWYFEQDYTFFGKLGHWIILTVMFSVASVLYPFTFILRLLQPRFVCIYIFNRKSLLNENIYKPAETAKRIECRKHLKDYQSRVIVYWLKKILKLQKK